MATQVQQLISRLRDADFRSNLRAVCDQVTNLALGLCCESPVTDYEYLQGDWQGSLETAMSVHGWIPDILEERTKPLSNPRIILPGELWDEFGVYFADEHYGISDETYDAYLDHIENRLLRLRKSEPFKLCELAFPESNQQFDYALRGVEHGFLLMQAKLLGDVSEEELKDSAERLLKVDDGAGPNVLGHIGDFDLEFCGVEFKVKERGLRRPDPDKRTTGSCCVQLSGRSSALAMNALIREIAPLAQSHFKSVKQLVSELNAENFKDFLPFGISGLEMAILNTSNKDTFQRRIANAVRLLAEADDQQSDPIGLSLCVTAIDALLGRKGQEMTNKLADFVAGLLEPAVDLRRQAADYVIKLYDKRSRVLHGDRLEGDSKLRDDARQLAASVLWGVWSYLAFFERFYSEEPKPEDLFRKLRDDFVKPGLPVGVFELPVRKRWAKADPENG